MQLNKFCLIGLALSLMFAVTSISAQTKRGAGNVRVKTDAGKIEDVKLYDASYALVIGASAYSKGWQKLPGVKSDMTAVTEALTEQGFTVEKFADPTSENFLPTVNRFVNKHGLQKKHRILIYFAGHGYTETGDDGRKFGYIVPVDAPDPAQDLLGFQQTAVSMDEIETVARKIRSKHALFIFDSCFSGTLLSGTRSPVPAVITIKATLPVRQFISAGAAAQEVPDVSIFRTQFVAGINGEADRNSDGYITASELAAFLEEKVTNYTNGSQTPQYGKIADGALDKGDFIFTVPGSLAPPCKKIGDIKRAEDFDQSKKVQIGGRWGEGVVWNAPPYETGGNLLEYNFNVNCTGEYALSVEYANSNGRVSQIYVNGEYIRDGLSNKTGGWEVNFQKWNNEGSVTLRKGKNTIRFSTRLSTPIPHIRAIRLEPGN